MAGVLQHLRSSALNKRPNPASMVDGQVAINYASGSPGMFFKDSNGSLVKVGPVHVGSSAPNATPASGGTAGNSLGEQWLDTSGGTYVFKIWDGAAWRSEAGEFVNATGDTMTGDLVMNNANLVFEGSVDDGFETTLTVVNPTADRTITLPNVTGTVVTTGDSGTVTSTMIADGTIVNDDVNASAAIAGTKISPDFGSQNRTSTGTSTAASFIPTSSSVPTNGMYLPSANNVAISTNGTGQLFVDASGNVGIGTTTPRQALTFGGLVSTSTATPDCIDLGATYTSTSASTNLKLKLYIDSSGNTYGFTTNGNSELEYYAGTVSSPGNHVFLTGGSERARITSSGQLLVGTSSTSSTAGLIVQGAGGAAPGIIRACYTTATPADGDIFGYLVFGDSAHADAAWVAAARDGGTWSGASKPTRLVFSTTADGASSPTERMRISSGGQVFIGTTSGNSSYQVIVGGDAPGGGSGGIHVSCDGVGDANYLSASDNIGFHFYSAGASSKTFYVENDGDVRNTNNSYGAISDLKLKQDIEDAGSQWNDLKAVQVRKFRFKSNPDDALHIGVIAQELESVSPGLIDETIDRDQEGNDLGTVTKSVKYSVLYMKAVKALQEAMERIETLEAKVAALEAQ